MKNKKLDIFFISSLKKGNKDAFQFVFEKYYSQLLSFVNFYTNDEQKSKDIVQDTYIKLWNKRENLNEDTNVLGLLHKISYNAYVDSYRKNKREKQMLDTFSYQRLNDLLENHEDEVKQKVKLVKKIIEDLPPKCKEIFKMSKFQGLKYAEIANQMGISIKTVESQMGKAFKIIRKKIN